MGNIFPAGLLDWISQSISPVVHSCIVLTEGQSSETSGQLLLSRPFSNTPDFVEGSWPVVVSEDQSRTKWQKNIIIVKLYTSSEECHECLDLSFQRMLESVGIHGEESMDQGKEKWDVKVAETQFPVCKLETSFIWTLTKQSHAGLLFLYV